MNIQLPVVIWTCICFLLLMLILKNLLFKPVFEVMDKRKLRIENAQKKKLEEEKLLKEHEEKNALLTQIAKEKRAEEIKKEIENIRLENKKASEEAREQRLVSVEEYKQKTEKEKEEILKSFNLHKDEITKTLADRIIVR